MAAISTWSKTAASNNAAPPDGWPEGQNPSSINDCAREMMSALRTRFEDLEWFNHGHVLVQQSANSFLVSSTCTEIYTAGRRIKLFDATTIYGTVLSSGASGSNTLITVSSSALTSSLSSGEVSIINPANRSLPSIDLATPQATTSGTSIDFTGIPGWVKRITIMFVGVSTSGTSNPLIQIGDAGGVETSGYLGAGTAQSNASAISVIAFTTGFGIAGVSGSNVYHGAITLYLENPTSFTWVANGLLAHSQAAAESRTAGSKSLSAALDRVRITTVGGADTFDAGAINISYE